MKRYYSIIMFFLIGGLLFAQEQLQPTNQISIESVSESIIISKQPQTITLRVGSNYSGLYNYLALQLDSTRAVWTVLAARLNGEELWLVQTDTRPGQANLMGWQFDNDSQMLRLYPGEWPVGFDLEVDVQLNLLNVRAAGDRAADRVMVLANLGEGVFRCIDSGRGSGIRLDKQ